MDKQELLNTMLNLRKEWDRLIEQIGRDQLIVRGTVGDWSVKDLIAHLNWNEKQTLGMLKAKALVGSELWTLSEDERNAAVYEKNRTLPLDAVLEESRTAFMDLVDTIEGITEQELLHADWFAALPFPGDWPPVRVIDANVVKHYRHHLEDLRQVVEE